MTLTLTFHIDTFIHKVIHHGYSLMSWTRVDNQKVFRTPDLWDICLSFFVVH